MTDRAQAHIGTSGWHYEHWIGPFYPEGLGKENLLQHYVEHFRTVEVNNTFYQLPEEKTLRNWRDRVPEDFTFSVKASRYITHMKKLKDPREPVANFIGRVALLGDKLGPILFQLPPNWHFNGERLASFLNVLPAEHRYAFEFRDPSWLTAQAYDLLAEHGAAFCIYDFAHRLSPKEVTADFVYVRLHGPDDAYQGKYGPEALSDWADTFASWLEQGKDVYCYFDNDMAGYAVQNALALREMLE